MAATGKPRRLTASVLRDEAPARAWEARRCCRSVSGREKRSHRTHHRQSARAPNGVRPPDPVTRPRYLSTPPQTAKGEGNRTSLRRSSTTGTAIKERTTYVTVPCLMVVCRSVTKSRNRGISYATMQSPTRHPNSNFEDRGHARVSGLHRLVRPRLEMHDRQQKHAACLGPCRVFNTTCEHEDIAGL